MTGGGNQNPEGIGFWQLVREDARTQEHGIWSSGFVALFSHRLGNWRMGLPGFLRPPFTLLYRMVYRYSKLTHGIDLPYTVPVGRRVRLEHQGAMILVANGIGNDVTIRQNTTFGIKTVKALHDRPVIGNGVDIGVGAVILGAVRIGDGAVIGANAVVVRDVPPGATAVGIPARILNASGTSDS